MLILLTSANALADTSVEEGVSSLIRLGTEFSICDYRVYLDGGSVEFCIESPPGDKFDVWFENGMGSASAFTFSVSRVGEAREPITPNSPIEQQLLNNFKGWLKQNYSITELKQLGVKIASGDMETLSNQDYVAMFFQKLPYLDEVRKQ